MTQRTRLFADLDQYVTHPRLSGLSLSPDGSRLVTTVSVPNAKNDGYVGALWEIDPSGARPARRLTQSAEGEASPEFSASGDLYFTSARPGRDAEAEGSALFRLPAAGGEAELVHRRAGGVSRVHCAPDAAPGQAPVTLVTAAVLPGAQSEEQQEQLHALRKKASVNAILHSGYPIRFWDHDLGPARPSLFAVESAQQHDGEGATKLRPLTPGIGASFSGEVWLNREGTEALIGVTVPEAGAEQRSALAMVDIATGERRMLADEPGFNFTAGPISPDGQSAAVVRSAKPTPERAPQPQLHLLDLASGELRRIAEDADLWLNPAAWLPDGSGLLALADQDGRGPIFRVATTGGVQQITTEDATYSAVVVSRDGLTAYGVRSSYAHPEEVVSIQLSAGETTRLQNPHERPELPGSLTEVETTAADGARVRAWLALPEGASAQKPAPLLLWIHGGPLNSWNAWTWRWNPWLMVEQGYAVLLPDPALSTGYGQDFVQRGWNSWGGKPFTDLMAITDVAEERADIDASRTAAMGGSFGGYMANWIAGQTDRFDAIVTHASLWALDQFGPTTDMASYWRHELDERMAAEHSPHRHVENIVSPMLVIHGDKDYRVPIGEGLRLWYELLANSGLPADADGATVHRFLYFPEENHWVLTPQHAKVWYEVVLGFLAEHVLGESRDLPAELGLTAP